MTVPVARIIDDPDSTGEPVSPKKNIAALCCCFIGRFVAGICDLPQNVVIPCVER